MNVAPKFVKTDLHPNSALWYEYASWKKLRAASHKANALMSLLLREFHSDLEDRERLDQNPDVHRQAYRCISPIQKFEFQKCPALHSVSFVEVFKIFAFNRRSVHVPKHNLAILRKTA
jgi:hypothetical protein